ncbi:site-specific DNA-methyltransferase [Aliarcobacter cryaerophilus]|uniref:site-specific DNA-methyltransferase n=1 Tax=Aliarcobacter cryaerophilus TaxID=28198 RepID=UPI003DA40E79
MDIREEKLFDNNGITANSKQLEILKNNFPQCFDKNGNFIVTKIEELVTSNGLELSKESYSLNWLGKSYARLLANENPLTMLKEDKNHNNLKENKNSQNILIKGDNLEVLKHLRNAYENQIKMIYIDPPYNTGKDNFVYNDDRKYTIDELSELAGISAEEARRIIEFTTSNSNTHSAWLTFMYPRLYIAKELLKKEGVIFISIDDNEAFQLKLLCDEIFGEENFLGEIIWETATDNNKSQIAIEHEYIFAYAKNKNVQKSWEINSDKTQIIQKKYEEIKSTTDDIDEIQKQLRKWINSLKKSNDIDLSGVSHYSYVDEFGVYYPGNSNNTKPGDYQYDIIHPITNKSCKKPSNGWRWPEITFLKAKEEQNVQWGKDENTIPKIKKRLETAKELLKSYYYEDNRMATSCLKSLFNNKKVFENPKSLSLIMKLMKFSTESDSIILDFFGGSGTTGHAVFKLNYEEKSNRKFIIVQLAEEIDNKKNETAYNYVKKVLKNNQPTIFDITKERILKAGQLIQKEIQIDKFNYDFGFKIFETRSLLENPLEKMDKFDEKTPQLFDVTTLKEDDFNAILTTWKVYDCMKLTDELKEVTFKSYKAYYGDKKLYFIHSGFTTDDLKELIIKLDEDRNFVPETFVLFGYIFESRYQREISEAFNSYVNKKEIKIKIVVRH